MIQDDYGATGINAFSRFEDLLKTRRKMLSHIPLNNDESQRKFKLVRARFNHAVLTEFKNFLDYHKSKPEMTADQLFLLKKFHNSLCDLEAHIAHYLSNHGKDQYINMLNNVRELGFEIIADWKKHFSD